MSRGAWPRPSDSRWVRLALHLLEGALVGGALVLVLGLSLGLSRVAGGLVAGDPLSVLLFLLAAAFALGPGATVVRLVDASTLLLAVVGYAFVLHRFGVRL